MPTTGNESSSSSSSSSTNSSKSRSRSSSNSSNSNSPKEYPNSQASQNSYSYDSDSSSSSSSSSSSGSASRDSRKRRSIPLAETQAPADEKKNSVLPESSPLYEDFMPGKEESSTSSSQDTTSSSSHHQQQQQQQQQQKPQFPGEESLPLPLTKEDWIDILAGALQRSSQSRGRRKRSPISEDEEPAEDLPSSGADSQEVSERAENSKVLGNLSSAVLESGGRQVKKSKTEARVLQPTLKNSASAAGIKSRQKKPASESGVNAGWKKKLLALQKAQAQLSSRVSALLDLTE